MADPEQSPSASVVIEAGAPSILVTTRTEYRWRIENGVRVRYRFLIDPLDTILDERIARDEDLNDERDKHLLEQGYGFRREGNQVMVTSVPKIMQDATRAIAGSEPCWFEGCAEIRIAYQEEMGTLKKNCPDCEAGKIIRKYTEMAKEALLKHGSATTAPGN